MARNHALRGPVYDMIRDLIADGWTTREARTIVQRQTGEVFSLQQIGGMKPLIHSVGQDEVDPLVKAIWRDHPHIVSYLTRRKAA